MSQINTVSLLYTWVNPGFNPCTFYDPLIPSRSTDLGVRFKLCCEWQSRKTKQKRKEGRKRKNRGERKEGRKEVKRRKEGKEKNVRRMIGEGNGRREGGGE